jgi:hypothetical protein
VRHLSPRGGPVCAGAGGGGLGWGGWPEIRDDPDGLVPPGSESEGGSTQNTLINRSKNALTSNKHQQTVARLASSLCLEQKVVGSRHLCHFIGSKYSMIFCLLPDSTQIKKERSGRSNTNQYMMFKVVCSLGLFRRN